MPLRTFPHVMSNLSPHPGQMSSVHQPSLAGCFQCQGGFPKRSRLPQPLLWTPAWATPGRGLTSAGWHVAHRWRPAVPGLFLQPLHSCPWEHTGASYAGTWSGCHGSRRAWASGQWGPRADPWTPLVKPNAPSEGTGEHLRSQRKVPTETQKGTSSSLVRAMDSAVGPAHPMSSPSDPQEAVGG